jgi:hypothetical protein
MPKTHVVMTLQRAEEITKPLAAAVVQAQLNGFTVDEVLTCYLLMAGSLLKQRGAVIDLDKPLRYALPEIAQAYESNIVLAPAVDRSTIAGAKPPKPGIELAQVFGQFNAARERLGKPPLPLEEVIDRLRKPICLDCAGTGLSWDVAHKHCRSCDGKGEM